MKKRAVFINKAIITLIGISSVQVLTILLLLLYASRIPEIEKHSDNLFKIKIIIVILSIMAMINLIKSIGSIIEAKRWKIKIVMQEESIKHIANLNNTLRAQRHDFLNHLQVVYSLIELDEYKDAKEYIEEVYKDIKKVSKVMRTSQPAINALLQAKMVDCESKNIDLSLNISTKLENIQIPSWEICRVLSNLVDNAIFELCRLKNNRKLIIDIHEELNNYVFSVQNNGTRIPEEIIYKIFEPTFTTKGEKGQGMGLAITKEIVEEWQGNIEVTSNDEFTKFTAKVPLKQDMRHYSN